MKQRNLSFLLAMLLNIVAIQAFAYDAKVNGIYYNLNKNNKTASVTCFSSSTYNSNKDAYTGDVIIPEFVTHDGLTYSVTSIGDYSFRNCGRVTSISIPSGVTSLGYDSFQGCIGLTSVTIPSSVIEIGRSAFYNCSNISSITLSSSLLTIRDDAFYKCSSIKSITLPDGLRTIGRYAFYGCSSIKSITLPSSLQDLGEYAFMDCSSLSEVNCLSSTPLSSSAYYKVFSGCGNPMLIVPDGTKEYYQKVDPWKGFKAIFELSNKPLDDGQFLYQINIDKVSASIVGFHDGIVPETVAIPDYIGEQQLKVTNLGYKLFYFDNNVKHLIIGKNITSFSSYALYCPYALEDVVISEDNLYYTSMDGVVFSKDLKKLMLYPPGKKDVTRYEIPNGVTSIDGLGQFYHSQLSEVVIPSSVNHIQTLSFAYSANLKVVHCLNPELPFVGSSLFWETKANQGILYVPKGCSKKYRGDAEWAVFKSIIEQDEQETKEAYAVINEDGTLLSFYYDGLKSLRSGMKYELNTGENKPDWFSDGSIQTITKVVFDSSFADASPSTTYYWFSGANKMKSIEGINNLNTSNVTNMASMFAGCSSLTNLDVSNFNTSNVTDMSYMFQGCSGLTSLDLSSFNTSNVTDMGCMFEGCSGLTKLDVSSFNTSNVTNMGGMFNGCSSLTSLDVSNFNTSIVTNMSGMFAGCSGLTSLDLSSFDTNNVKYVIMSAVSDFVSGGMESMFSGCSGLISLDLSNFDTSNVRVMISMFKDCSNLRTTICGDKWDTDKVEYSEDMFSGCTNLIGGAGTKYNSKFIDKTYAHVDGGPSNPGYLTLKGGEVVDGDDLQRYLDSLVDTEDEFVNNVYRRVFLNDNWQALYVPFAVNYSSWADKFEVARIDGDLNSRSDLTWLGATIVESGDLEANYPYLIRAKSKAGATLTVNVNSSAQKTSWVSFGPYSFKGNYSKLTGLKSSRYYRLQGGTLSIPYNDSEVLLPFRWYMRIAGNQAARELRLSINGEEATGIENVNNSQSSPQVYTLSGRRVAVDAKSLPKGVYIINNKKCVIK